MKSKTLYLILAIFCVKLLIVFLIDYRSILYLSLISTLFLLIISFNAIINRISGIAISLLGFATLSFFDIFKFNFIFLELTKQKINITAAHHMTAIYIYISFIVFLVTYLITNSKEKKRHLKVLKISQSKTQFIFLPVMILVLFTYLTLANIIDANNIYLLLLSFIPKSCVIVCFYLFLQKKKLIHLLFSCVFLLSFNDISRRVYITLGFIVIALIMSDFMARKGSIRFVHKMLMILLFGFAFFWMNYLRSDFFIEKELSQQEKLNNTFDSMLAFNAIDTYDNTAFIVRTIPDLYPHYYGSTYTYIFLQYIPRSIWPSKPGGFGAALGLLKSAGIRDFSIKMWQKKTRGFSLSPGMIGEAYANFGVFGVFLIPILLGFFTKRFDGLINFELLSGNFYLLPYTSFYSTFFLVHRGDFVSALYYPLFFFMFLSVMVKICKSRTWNQVQH